LLFTKTRITYYYDNGFVIISNSIGTHNNALKILNFTEPKKIITFKALNKSLTLVSSYLVLWDNEE